MIEHEYCPKHPGQPLTKICISKGCEDRSLCSICYQAHNGLHDFIRWDIKLALKEVAGVSVKRKQLRLKSLMDCFKGCLRRSIDAFEESLDRQIRLTSEDIFMECSGQNQMLVQMVRQFIVGDYSQVTKDRFEQLQLVMQKIDQAKPQSESVEFTPLDEAIIYQLVGTIEERLRLLEKLMWMKPKPKSQIKGMASKEKAASLIIDRPVEEAKKKFAEILTELQAEETRLSKLVDQRKNRSVISICKTDFTNSNLLTKVLNRVYNSSEVTSLGITNSGLSDLKSFELLEGSPFAHCLISLDLSGNQICSAMELCVLKMPLLEELKLGKNKIVDLKCFEWHPWQRLRVLDLNSNAFKSISSLQRWKMPALQDLILDWNRVETICPIGRCSFPSMSKLSLNDVAVADNIKLADIYFDDPNLRKKVFMTL